MVHIVRIRKDNKLLEDLEWRAFINDLQAELRKAGFDAYVNAPSPTQGVTISDVRLSEDYVKKQGYNVSPYTGRKGKILGWKNWVAFNNTLNKVMNRHKISATAKSLGGKFMIRKGGVPYTAEDWEGLKEENVGSMMKPVTRGEAWVSEKEFTTEELKGFRKRARSW